MHVDLAQWQPDPYVQTATAESWRRAFQIASLRRDGVTATSEIARRLGVDEQTVEGESRLIPYLDRTVAGLLSVLGWHLDSRL